MLTINSNFQQLLEKENIFSFINTSIQQISYNIPDLFQRKEYWLFYYIKDDFWANCASLYRMDIEQDFLGFPLIRKNTRHAIEAFFDFYNLCYDPDYMCVLENALESVRMEENIVNIFIMEDIRLELNLK